MVCVDHLDALNWFLIYRPSLNIESVFTAHNTCIKLTIPSLNY